MASMFFWYCASSSIRRRTARPYSSAISTFESASILAASAFALATCVIWRGARRRRPSPSPPVGLSPRVRGSRPSGRSARTPAGSIPACAGGAVPTLILQHNGSGLSPRVRGSRAVAIAAGLSVRSIPACAGEPCRPCPSRSASRVYPRVCGGADEKGGSTLPDWGLSPRVRGSRRSSLGRDASAGSIPACAGEPLRLRPLRPCIGVYPRVCGGAFTMILVCYIPLGLSPRVRGSRPPRESGLTVPGSIPACAGEPRRRRSQWCR